MYLRLPAVLLLLASVTAYAEDHFCPPADVVKKNEHNVQAFKNDKLYWRIAFRGWPYADQIGFDQVFYYPQNNKIDCRYRWVNPEKPGTYLWTAVELSADADSTVEISGNNWDESNEVINCTGGRPESCSFKVKSGKNWLQKLIK